MPDHEGARGAGEPSLIPNVQRIRRPDGEVYLYFRKGAVRRHLASPDGSEELRLEVQAIRDELSRAGDARRPRAATVGGALRIYNRSAEFLALARSTQASYQRLIDEIEADAGDVLFSDIDAAWVREMKDAWAPRGYRAANLRLQVLFNALEPSITDQAITPDPFSRLKKVRRPHGAPEPHPIWEDAEVEAAIELAIARKQPGLARAIALGRWAGFRRQTICSLPRHARVRGTGVNTGLPERRILWLTEKRKVLADRPEDPRLTALLARTPDLALTVAYNADGEPWKPRQLNQAMDRLTARLAREGRARAITDETTGEIYSPLDIHGLRHARGVELAEAGASDAEIMAQLEHSTPRAATIYRRQAQRRRLATGGQDKVTAAVDLKAARTAKTTAANEA